MTARKTITKSPKTKLSPTQETAQQYVDVLIKANKNLKKDTNAAQAKVNQEFLRQLIDSEKIIELLQLSITDPVKAKLTSEQLYSIKCLLAKVLPDLKAVEQTTTIKGGAMHNIQVNFIDKE